MNKHTPTLEQRVVTALANPNNGSEALVELIRETETAAQAADQSAAEERRLALDLVLRPNPKEAHDAVVGAEITRDRLKANLPKLRDKLAEALAAEAKERWWEDYRRVRQQRDDAATNFQRYPALSRSIASSDRSSPTR
jgi:hypothetical protein